MKINLNEKNSDRENLDKNKLWLAELAAAVTSSRELVSENLVPQSQADVIDRASELFDIRVPHIFKNQIKNKNHPLSNQFVPSAQELIFFPEQLADPIGDELFTPVEGLTHRYPDRVLLKPTYLCGSYCRFCFRKYKVSDAHNNLTWKKMDLCFEYIKNHPEIWEVILTGGDPLVLTDQYLNKIISNIQKIPHVKIIRFHTRIPSVLPSRITDECIELLTQTEKTVWIAVHINSVHEFTEPCIAALKKLTNAGIPLLLQSVLLHGVNDSHHQLVELFKKAVEYKIKPYYLHYPDMAQGTKHFQIPLQKALDLVHGLLGKISGMCIPPLVVDIPGGKGKVTIDNQNHWKDLEGNWVFKSPLDGSLYNI